jgi:hypothetical protein
MPAMLTAEDRALAERLWEEKTAEASTLTTSCPACGKEGCKVVARFSQATRWEPMTFLGFDGYCPECAVSFRAENPQLTL